MAEVEKHERLPPHPNCVHFIKAWEERGHLYIQTELCKMRCVYIYCIRVHLAVIVIWQFCLQSPNLMYTNTNYTIVRCIISISQSMCIPFAKLNVHQFLHYILIHCELNIRQMYGIHGISVIIVYVYHDVIIAYQNLLTYMGE